MDLPSQLRLLKFGVFELDLQAGELRKSGMRLKLAGQPLQVLQALLEHPQEVVTREQLRKRLWPDNTFVDFDLALKKAVNRLRDALGDSAENPRYIETIPRQGYRFIGTLEAARDAGVLGRLRTRILAGTRPPEIHSLAVLPLENLSKDPAQDYFSDGMTDALTTELAQIGALRVISRTSAMHFRGTRETLPEIGS